MHRNASIPAPGNSNACETRVPPSSTTTTYRTSPSFTRPAIRSIVDLGGAPELQNVDFKCELRDPGLARLALKRFNSILAATVSHRDTFFRVPDGRLMRREAEGEPVEYVLYHRVDRPIPTISRFTILSEDEARLRLGAADPPVWVEVWKQREIWLLQNARVHLDQVEGLGWFMEIDVLVTRDQHVGRCHELIRRIREALAPALGGLIATSYADMVAMESDAA